MIDLGGRGVIQREMKSVGIVEMNGFSYGPASAVWIGKTLVHQVFQLEDAIDPFGHDVVVGVARGPHAGTDPCGLQKLLVRSADVLNAVVTITDHALGFAACGLDMTNGHLHGP